MKLHHRWQQDALSPTENTPNPLPVVLLHGLFGNLDNLGVIARDLKQTHPLLQLDLRNHGLSPHDDIMDYPTMANDVLTLLNDLNIEKAFMIGHSMGGKVAMALTALAPERIEKLVSIDIAPVDYPGGHHQAVLEALRAVSDAQVTSRQEAMHIMQRYIHSEGVIQFLLKSFHEGQWRFNTKAIIDQYEKIAGWQEVPSWLKPVLFICGGDSPYVKAEHREAILRQFPRSQAHVIAGSGHWVHAEQPEKVLRLIHRFFQNDSIHQGTQQ